MPYKTVRRINLSALIVCLFLFGFAAYLQIAQDLQPCPLCILQRWILLGSGLLFLIGSLHIPRQNWLINVHAVFIVFVNLLGALVAGRQVWLQYQPAGTLSTSCGADLAYLMEHYPFFESIKIAFQGTGDCAEVVWRFLGLSIPGWTFLFFVLFAAIGVWQLVMKFRD